MVFLSELSVVSAQNIPIQTSPRKHKIYTSDDGFLVQNVSSIFFDNDGWLWIAGQRNSPNEYKIESFQSVIQRYNGSSFHTIPLPNIEKDVLYHISLKKRTDGLIYIHCAKGKLSKLFLLNPKTLKIHEIQLPENKKSNEYYEFTFFPYQEGFLAFININKKSYTYRLDNNQKFTLLQEIPNIKDVFVNDFMDFEDHFVSSDERMGVLTFDTKGNVTHVLKASEIKLNQKNVDYKLNINALFEYNGDYYVNFLAGSEDYYKYNSESRSWEKAPVFRDKKYIEKHQITSSSAFNDTEGNVVLFTKDKEDQGIRLKRYLNDLNSPDFSYVINIESIPFWVSGNFEKEIFFAMNGELHHIIFESQNFSIFLKEYPMRGILLLNNEEAIVSAEANGWFHLNLKTKETKRYEVKLFGQPYLPDGNRGFFKTDTGFWSTYNKGIVHLDDKTRELKTFAHYPVAAMVEDSGSIYYGTERYNLMQFDKKSGEQIPLANTDTLIVQDVIKKGTTIYAATESGLLIHKKEKTVLLQPKAKEDHFLLSAKYSDNYGVLLGSRSGKLFQYDSIKQTFNTIYKDSLNASIATFLFDSKNRIWLNTFLGIVAYDPKSKTSIRYGENDGLSHHESNRYSAAVTDDGYFLVGTLRGLNYFHPDSLTKNKIKATLELSSLTRYEKKKGKQVQELSPEKLHNIKEINLPAEQRNIELEFGLLGEFITESISYRYRLNKEIWNNLGSKNKLNLINMSPGIYSLEVEALDSSRERIGEVLKLELNAQDFFYNSIWFYILVLVIFLAFGFWYVFQLKQRHVLKEEFASKLINTQENERSRIAKELHDSIGQKLLVLKNTLLLKKEKEPEEIKIVESTIKEVREMSHNMHPFQFKQLGLTKSLRNLIDAFQRTSTVFYSSEIEEVDHCIPEEKEIFLFRMLQECISNVEKHSQATACNLRVVSNEKYIYFILKDNGKGFEYEEQLNSTKNLGLQTLKERAQYINAILKIESKAVKGTTITITISKQ